MADNVVRLKTKHRPRSPPVPKEPELPTVHAELHVHWSILLGRYIVYGSFDGRRFSGEVEEGDLEVLRKLCLQG